MTHYLKQAWWVVSKGNDLILYDGNGQEVFGQESIRVTSTVNEIPSAICKFVVNIAGSEEEMKQRIEELKTK
jgi:hypothetical protein